MVRGEHHISVATNMRGATVLHWGVSKLSPGEWLVSNFSLTYRMQFSRDLSCSDFARV